MLQPDLRGLGRVYRHSQRATLVLWSLVGGAVIDVVVIVMVARVAPTIVLVAPAVGLIVLVACAVLFHSLSVEVTTTKVRLWFGPGLIHKTFAASEIREARVVRNSWTWGWGIRWTPHGWLFNVSGLDAVEIELLSGRQYRIGTDQPHELHAAILGVKS